MGMKMGKKKKAEKSAFFNSGCFNKLVYVASAPFISTHPFCGGGSGGCEDDCLRPCAVAHVLNFVLVHRFTSKNS